MYSSASLSTQPSILTVQQDGQAGWIASVGGVDPVFGQIANPVSSSSYTLSLSDAAIQADSNMKAMEELVKPASAPVPVDYTNNIKKTRIRTIDALLAGGNSWWNTGVGADGANPSASALHNLTFSFASDSSELAQANDRVGFQALSAAQKDVVRDALAYISSVVNITFTEVGSGGDIKLASNNQGGASAGYSYYPNSGAPEGQVMLANDQATFADADSWEKGGYTWETIIHEVGHALGLKHPGNYNAGGGGTPGPYLPGAKDNRTNTIMSYKDDKKYMHLVENIGGNQLHSSYVNPDSLQLYDIAALQYLYGAATTASATTYTFNDDDKFSRTLYDTHSDSAIDLSGMGKDNLVDLRGGYFSAIGLQDAYADTGMTKEQYLAATSGGVKLSKLLGKPTYTGAHNLAIAKGSQIQTAIGGSGNDSLVAGAEIGGTAKLDGGAGDDKFFISSGNAVINDTGGGNDSVYVVKKAGTIWTVSEDYSTLIQTSKKTGETLASISLAGIENVGYWGGKAKIKSVGKPLLPVIPQQLAQAYAPPPEPTASLGLSLTA